MLMKKAKGATKTVFPKASIEKLKDMSLEDYTKVLARDMVKTLNATTRRRVASSAPKRSKRK
jgi:hypothetical protein